MRSTVGGAYRDAASYGIVGQGLESLNVGSFLGRSRTANRIVEWNLGEAVITKSHHNWSKIFGNRSITLADINPIVKEAVNNGSWKVTDVIRKKGGRVIGDKLEMVRKVNGYKIWVGGMREHSTGKIIVNNAAVQ